MVPVIVLAKDPESFYKLDLNFIIGLILYIANKKFLLSQLNLHVDKLSMILENKHTDNIFFKNPYTPT
jgi:hypothetical protein